VDFSPIEFETINVLIGSNNAGPKFMHSFGGNYLKKVSEGSSLCMLFRTTSAKALVLVSLACIVRSCRSSGCSGK
jgi:hypothetical protein